MKFIKFFIWAGVLSVVLSFMHSGLKFGDTKLPALGKLFDPIKGFWANAETGFSDQTLQGINIKDDISISFDEHMVAHIFASNTEDALFAQGYVEAYHRLFQMDLSARSAGGRLAEVLGSDLIEKDKQTRRIGMTYAAENAVSGWQKTGEQQKYIHAYVDGVNAYIDQLKAKDYPFEFKLLNYQPESWSLLKSANILKAMSLVLCGYEEDVEFSNAYQKFGAEDFALMYPEYDMKNSPIIPKGTQFVNLDSLEQVKNQKDLGYHETIERFRSPPGVGSNNWAVGGSKTKSGKPILANDPHLGLSLPSVWYQLHIHTPEYSAYGVSLLGMPGIMIGFNQDIAWGETNVGHDVMDWYTIDWTDDQKTSYKLDNGSADVTYRVEEIKVRGGESILDTVKYAHWGPIQDKNGRSLALRWIAHQEPDKPEYLAFIDAMKVKNYDEYLEATSNFLAPAQNFAYADRHGEIGLRINGKLPIKKQGQGRMLSDGSKRSSAWEGFIKREDNPQTRNPERGYISSANQWSTDDTYPYYYNGNFEAYRGRAVNRALDTLKNITPETMMQMQMNSFSIKAEESLPIMLDALTERNRKDSLAIILRSWDYVYKANAQAPALYNAWWYYLTRGLWDEVRQEKDIDLPYPDDWRTVQILTEGDENKFWDVDSTATKEDMAIIINNAFTDMKDYLKEKSDDFKSLEYSHFKKVNIYHLTQVPALSELGIISDGHKDVINAVSSTFGPSWRMVVGLGDTPDAYGIYPGGQSGNPGSRYYKNMIADWSKGKHMKLNFPQSPFELDTTLFTIEMKAHEK